MIVNNEINKQELLKELLEFLRTNLEHYPLTKFTLHETIKSLTFMFFYNKDMFYVPEFSRFKTEHGKSMKKKADGIVLVRNASPSAEEQWSVLFVIEIDRVFQQRNYDTLMLWNCDKVWIDYKGIEIPNKLPKNGISLLKVVDGNSQLKGKLCKRFLRSKTNTLEIPAIDVKSLLELKL